MVYINKSLLCLINLFIFLNWVSFEIGDFNIHFLLIFFENLIVVGILNIELDIKLYFFFK